MAWPTDGVASFFLICFFIGLVFTVGSFLLGVGDGVAHSVFHIDFFGHGADGNGGHNAGGDAAGHAWLSFFNISTIMAFLTWFGGAGFILRSYYGVWAFIAVILAIISGLGGGALVYLFFAKVLYASERTLDPRDYFLPGTLARVTSSIREGGVGEVVYSKGDARHVSGARSEDGTAIERGAEVVIMRYEKGLAYVERWDELMREREEAGNVGASGTSLPA